MAIGLAGLLAVANAAPMYGEQQGQVQRGLGPNNGTTIVNWNNPNTVLYTSSNPNGFVVLHVVPRSPVGSQPLTYSLSVGSSSATFTTASVTLLNSIVIPPASAAFTGTQGQSIVITPLVTTNGNLIVDVLGYEPP